MRTLIWPLLLIGLLTLARPAAADEGWVVTRFHADIEIRRDGSLQVAEAIDVDFGALERHGIFREIPVRYAWDDTRDRVFEIEVTEVRDATGRAWPFTTERSGANERIRIGDADRFVSGAQSYVIRYTVRGALNAFDDHDELYWNVNGANWPVPTRRASAFVRLPLARVAQATCFQGEARSTTPCQATLAPDGASYLATRPLGEGEQLTIVAALPKGAVAVEPPLLEPRARDLDRWFDLTPPSLGATGVVLAGGLWLVGRNWWRRGRDRRFIARAGAGGPQETAPLFDGATVVAEFEPPDRLRPAQLGLILDERADVKDLTATLVDLAARGYLRIEQVPKVGVFGREDWRLVRLAKDDPLEGYERALFDGLLPAAGDAKLLSELRGKSASTLQAAQRLLYQDAVQRRLFTGDPERARQLWLGVGCATVVAGGVLVAVLGAAFGFALVGVAVLVCGLALVVLHSAMARRSAVGRELLRRTLGFRRYMETAEKDRAAFAEREGLFTEYLPYAIVFGCALRWARAFEGLGREPAAPAWYAGAAAFSPLSFSRELETFSSTVSSTIAHTPGSSGSSGFGGGGSSGSGGGGGGGGSW